MYTRETIGVGIAVGQVVVERAKSSLGIMYVLLAAVWIAVGISITQL